ncbi:lyase family protein [Trinickia mobilis]|uniref:lyase family protein n=1 Tax=Trinickia mobilis TaxID=2816356 RepID=UPI001A8F0C73|nr:lyase family protein [Trinickia mobilis]
MENYRTEVDSLGEVSVPSDKLWGAQTQRSIEHFSIGRELMPREMITAYTVLKKAAANANHAGKRLDYQAHSLITQVCDEILAGQHHDMFPLHVWMTGSGTQFNMNLNEVISNRCCLLAGTPLASKKPVHPNDHVNMSQSSNDSFPAAMSIAAAVAELLIPENEPGSSIMPGKVNPTQVEALTMVAVQVMANDVAVGFGGAGGYLEMNVYKPLMIFNVTQSITLLTDGCTNFRRFLVEGTRPNVRKIREYVDRSLMLVTALVPVIGYDRASAVAHHAAEHDLTLKAAALELGFVDGQTFDRVVDPAKMVRPYVATTA